MPLRTMLVPIVGRLIAAAAVAALLGCGSSTNPPALEPGDRIYTLEVAPTRVACTGIAPQQCLQVREQQDAPYVLFYDTISGFTYEEGYRYLLRVDKRTVANPPADGSSKVYRLMALLSKTAA